MTFCGALCHRLSAPQKVRASSAQSFQRERGSKTAPFTRSLPGISPWEVLLIIRFAAMGKGCRYAPQARRRSRRCGLRPRIPASRGSPAARSSPSAKPRQRIKPFPMQKVPPSTGRTSGCFSGLSPRHWAADGWDCRSRSQGPSPHRGAGGAPSPQTAGYRYCRRSGCRWKGSAAYRRS